MSSTPPTIYGIVVPRRDNSILFYLISYILCMLLAL